jgi:secreted trypsin-like serine protease
MKIAERRLLVLMLLLLPFFLQSLVWRHDVRDEELFALAKPFNQVAHFYDGEGTLIANQWVLTAGHVADLYRKTSDPNKQLITINNKAYHIEKIVFHPDFKNFGSEGGLQNDVALVKLKEVVNGVVPAKLYTGKDEKGKIITLVGAGDIGTGLTGATKNDHLARAVTNRIDDVTESWITFRFDSPDSKNTTPYEGVSGPGDSGGPAFYQSGRSVYVIGISSNQAIEVDDNGKATEAGHYGVLERYTRVSSYKTWIVQAMLE